MPDSYIYGFSTASKSSNVGVGIIMIRVLAHFFSFVTKLFRSVGLMPRGLPPQPLFDLFRIHQGVYCGGIMMSKNTNWEMHVDGDETLTLLSGRIELVLEDGSDEKRITLTPGHSAVIPAGVWHRQIVESSGELLFMTFGDTTVHRTFEG